MDRRRFLRHAGLWSAAAALPQTILADPYAPLPPRPADRSLRVRGVVRSGAQGLSGVAVSDGFSTVRTGPDGSFELISAQPLSRSWDGGSPRGTIQITIPAGFRVPTHATGTARFYTTIEPDSRGEATARFELEPLPSSDDHHVALVLGDIQTQNGFEMRRFHDESVPDLLGTIAAHAGTPIFGLAVGDLMFDDLALYPEYERAVQRLGIPCFQVIGNHDLDQAAGVDQDSSRTFERHFGPRYYSFERGQIHYVVLDDVFWYGTSYLGYLDLDQLAWLRSDLAGVEPGRTVVVATHIPLQGTTHLRRGEKQPDPNLAMTNRELLLRLLEPYQAHVLVGHMHESEHVAVGRVHEHNVGAICGAWWSGSICADGTPNGYAIYEAHGAELRWRAKSTGEPADHQFRLYPPGTDPAEPKQLIANLWDWDPSWTVEWFEDGARRGAMKPRRGLDPLSVERQAGDDKPPRRTWVEPYLTDHLLRAEVSSRARRVTVEATDRFGRRAVQSLELTPGAKSR